MLVKASISVFKIKVLSKHLNIYQCLSLITGAGDFYSSGNDLNNFMEIDPANVHQAAKDGAVTLE